MSPRGGPFSVNRGESLRRALVDGLGAAYLPRFIVGGDLEANRLRAELEDWAWSAQGVCGQCRATASSRRRSARSSTCAHFTPLPPWGSPGAARYQLRCESRMAEPPDGGAADYEITNA
jgi:DNA-binding transcriptional LysR family regulator